MAPIRKMHLIRKTSEMQVVKVKSLFISKGLRASPMILQASAILAHSVISEAILKHYC